MSWIQKSISEGLFHRILAGEDSQKVRDFVSTHKLDPVRMLTEVVEYANEGSNGLTGGGTTPIDLESMSAETQRFSDMSTYSHESHPVADPMLDTDAFTIDSAHTPLHMDTHAPSKPAEAPLLMEDDDFSSSDSGWTRLTPTRDLMDAL